MQSVGIKGMGYYVPENVFTNFDFEKIIDTSDEWIRTRTSIVERRFASKDQATSDLAYQSSSSVRTSMPSLKSKSFRKRSSL